MLHPSAHMDIHEYTQACECIYIHTQTCIHTCTHTYALTHMYTQQTHRYTHVNICTHTHVHTTNTHTPIYKLLCMCLLLFPKVFLAGLFSVAASSLVLFCFRDSLTFLRTFSCPFIDLPICNQKSSFS